MTHDEIMAHSDEEETTGLEFSTLQDAKTFVVNSGFLEWDWSHEKYTNDEIVDELLPIYLRQNADGELTEDALIKNFITEVLNKDPADYF